MKPYLRHSSLLLLFCLLSLTPDRLVAGSSEIVTTLEAIQSPRDPKLASTLQKALEITDENIVSLACAAWTRLGDNSVRLPEAVRALAQACLAPGEPDLALNRKLNAIHWLETLPSPASEALLLQLTQDAQPRARCAALSALGGFPTSNAHHCLLNALKSDSPAEQKLSAFLLGNRRSLEALPDLLNLLSHTEVCVRKTAYNALCNITNVSFPPERKSWENWLAGKPKEDAAVVAQLRVQLTMAPEEFRPVIIEELPKYIFEKDKIVGLLVEKLYCENFKVRAAACHALGQLPDSRALQPLIDKLLDPRQEVASSAWRALKRITAQTLPLNYDAWLAWYLRLQG